jgi:glycosyltransferase involved in cell wall biosynthesis
VTEKEYRIFSNNTKLRLLFVGGLSQRKGLSYLFESVKGLESYVSLTVVGQGNTDCKPLKEKLLQHRWITSVPHDTILQLMREHDVLVFPSLFEGFGQVITEAMSQGTPVITTDRTIGPDIIKNRENGWIVKSGSAEAIKQVVEELLMHPKQIAARGEQAIATAAKRPWTEYGNDLVKAITEIKMPDKVF